MLEQQLVTPAAAAKEDGAPSKQALYKMVKRDPAPEFVVEVDGKRKVDLLHPAWLSYVRKKIPEELRRSKISVKKGANNGQPAGHKSTSAPGSMGDLMRKAQQAEYRRLIADAETAEYKAAKAQIDHQRAIGESYPKDFAHFAFFGYWNRCNVELLSVRKRIAARVENLTIAGDWRAILDLFESEVEEVLREVKRSHEKDLETYEPDGS